MERVENVKKPVVAIVGRPNVGKSTIFNRIVGERVSIVEDIPGVTRDRIYQEAEWLNRKFDIIDTGGIEIGDEPLLMQIRYQAELAIDEADVIILMTNGKEGLTVSDEEVAELLIRSKKPVVLAVNKIDNPNMRDEIYDYYTLGFGTPFPISGSHGLGIGDLLDEVFTHFPKVEEKEVDEDVIRFCLVGRPNVGKSSLVNAILGEERVIVSDIEGTTRDAIDTDLVRDGQKFSIIDTAGMRRKRKIYESTEKYSVRRALKAIDRSNCVLVVLNGEQGIREQDKRIASYAHEAGRAIVLVVNKWDAVTKDDKTMNRMQEKIREEFQFLDYAQIVFLSAKTKSRMHTLMPAIVSSVASHQKRLATNVLNDVLMDAIAMNPTPTHNMKRLKIYYMTQVAVEPPTFVVFVNDPGLLHFSYKRFLENRIREACGFEGTPIHIIARTRE